ncbi:MAG: hypothetical protein IV084_10230 [Rugosibacter sp.]|nr:hypothetical protein [Rugosibacter sp.]
MNTSNSAPPKLLDHVRGKIRLTHYNIQPEQSYINWIKRFIRHFDKANHALTIKLVMCADTRIE